MLELSVIIPSFNTKDITLNCLHSISDALKHVAAEIIVVDNASSDGSVQALMQLRIKREELRIIANKENIGYSKANNKGLAFAKGKYILFLNSDVLIDNVDFNKLLNYMDDNPTIGALTVKVNLPTGSIDPASHRGFPTVWRSFTYFVGLEKYFTFTSFFKKIFGGYHLLHEDLQTTHEIDALTGAFFLTRKVLMDELKGFDEAFFMYGEDIDLAYRIKEMGNKIIYYPKYHVTHLKYKSGLGNKNTNVKVKIRNHFYEAMKIFYKKHYEKRYPFFINHLMYFFIDLKSKLS